MAELVDNYSEANLTAYSQLFDPTEINQRTRACQCLTLPSSIEITSLKFYLQRGSSLVTGTVSAKLYAVSGVVGSTAIPTGSALATSDSVDVSTITTGGLGELIEFTFPSPYIAEADDIAIALESAITDDGSYFVRFAVDGTGQHLGNFAHYRESTGGWSSQVGTDSIFYLYGNVQSITSPRSAADSEQFPVPPLVWSNETDHLRKLAEASRLLFDGKTNATGEVTLTASAATTTISDRRIGNKTKVILTPTTANASAEIGNGTIFQTFPNAANEAAVINHASNSQTDRTFEYTLTG